MEQKTAANITEDLYNVFQYAFVETASYHFIVPKNEIYAAIHMEEKVYLCDHCREVFYVKLKQNGQVYINRKLLEAQRHVYLQDGIPFPEVESGDPLVYRQHGYCCDCAAKRLQEVDEIGQKIYHLSARLLQLDAVLVLEGQQKADQIIKEQIAALKDVKSLDGLHLTEYPAVQQWICSVLANHDAKLKQMLKIYTEQSCRLTDEITALLERLHTRSFPAYVARPMTVYDTLDDGIYNEYTVIFPLEGTGSQEFYVLKEVDTARVKMFLKQQRINHISMFLRELRFDGLWIKQLLHRVKELEEQK